MRKPGNLICGCFFSFFAGLCLPLQGDIIPPERRVDWGPNAVGIPGGIPDRQTVFASVTDFGAVGDDSTDNRAAFQAAFNACPAGRVVTIPAGVFRVNGTLNIPSNMTIRGAGISTVIKSVGTGDTLFLFGSSVIPWNLPPLADVTTAIQSGAGGGSSEITVENSGGISVGMYLIISELNDPAFVTQVGSGGSANWVSGWGDNGARARGEIVEVTSVNGTTIGFTPALTSSYTHTPWATRFAAQCRWSGVENLKTYATNSGTMRNFYFQCAAYCWIKDVECDYADGDHATLDWSYRCEVRGNYFHDAYIHRSGQWDNPISLFYKTSRCLIVDNIFRRLHLGVNTSRGACGNVVAYNYFLESFDERYETTGQKVLMSDISINHGAHPQFNLYEGNVCNKIEPDFYWGSSSHNTIYRNHVSGHGYANPPFFGRDEVDASTVVQWNQQARALDIWDGQTYFNIIGNVLGDDFSLAHNAIRKVVHPQNRNYERYYMSTYGYTTWSDSGTLPATRSPVPSMIEHGNWDVVFGDTQWDPLISDRNLPASLCFPEKPGWFGDAPWPPIGPDVAGRAHKIPAQLRYEALQGRGQTFSLVFGWNWISFNVLPADRSLNAVFGGILGQVEQVKTQARSSIRQGGRWMGDLADMDGIPAGEMYKVKVNADCTLTTTGSRIAANTSIPLATGWNWVAFYPDTPMPIAAALASIQGHVLEVKSRTQIAMFDGTAWSGSLTQLVPGEGYAIRVSGAVNLFYPEEE